ncbi:hypothetical protein HPB50_013131 [Hyalomma asiaticum]|uniref:Uncharacterized protein n=1 Tax=Hyalomma asiaticum TaxID=266040 RepID=A0ACB7RNC6_HYAAI|nr:hypothetical protein HPB50_013131 [Hyalomma asiaticum]
MGQHPLLCLARVLLQILKVLMLDEATAGIDLKTGALIQRMVLHEFSNSTILIIAHRLSTVLDYDRILVLEQGWVAKSYMPVNLQATENSILHGMARGARTT